MSARTLVTDAVKEMTMAVAATRAAATAKFSGWTA
jgi:hypothetical protein